MFKKIKGWLCGWKFWVCLLAVIIGTVLFGSFVSTIGAVIFDVISKIIGFVATALRWLADILNFFGWYGFFT